MITGNSTQVVTRQPHTHVRSRATYASQPANSGEQSDSSASDYPGMLEGLSALSQMAGQLSGNGG